MLEWANLYAVARTGADQLETSGALQPWGHVLADYTHEKHAPPA